MLELQKIISRLLIIIWFLVSGFGCGLLALVSYADGDSQVGNLFLSILFSIGLISWGMWHWRRWALWTGVVLVVIGSGFQLAAIQYVGFWYFFVEGVWLLYFMLPAVRRMFH